MRIFHAWVLGALFLSSFCGAETVKIGVILPMSGNSAELGQKQMRAVALFKKDLEQNTYRHKYEIIVEDDQLTPRLTAQAAQKLINVDHVQALISLNSAAGNVIAPQARAHQILHVGLAVDPKIADAKFNFLHAVQVEAKVELFAKILQAMQAKRVAMLCLKQQATLKFEELARKRLGELGIEIAESQFFNPGERDFRILLTRIREKKPDVFVPHGFSPEMEIILRQAKQLGLGLPITTSVSFDFMNDLSDAEGYFYVSECYTTDEFEKRMLAETGLPSAFAVPYTYDALCMLRAAFESAPNANPAEAGGFLAKMKDFPSSLGPVSMQADGRTNPPAGLFRIVGGKAVRARLEDIPALAASVDKQ